MKQDFISPMIIKLKAAKNLSVDKDNEKFKPLSTIV